jgi:hypothetical protein
VNEGVNNIGGKVSYIEWRGCRGWCWMPGWVRTRRMKFGERGMVFGGGKRRRRRGQEAGGAGDGAFPNGLQNQASLEVCRRRAARVHRGQHCSSVCPEALKVACCKTLEAGKDERGKRIWSSTARGNEEGHFR